jgi:hypothetical protein
MATIPNRRSYTALRTNQYKGIDNAWLSPEGKLYACGFMGHNEWASDYMFDKVAKKNWDAYMKLTPWNGYPYQYLHSLGWYRLLTWSGNTTKLLNEGNSKLTSDQEDTLMFWCSANGHDYETLIQEGYVIGK